MAKLKKKLKFEFDNMQMFLLFVGSAIIGILVFYAGMMAGSKSAQKEILALKSNMDLRKRIKAPSLLNQQKIRVVKKKAPTIEDVLDAASSGSSQKKVKKKVNKDAKAKSPKSAPAKVRKESKGKAYYVQAASFKNAEVAHNKANALDAKGYDAVVMKTDIPGKGIFYRVGMGPFKDINKAKAFSRKFEKKEKASTFISIN